MPGSSPAARSRGLLALALLLAGALAVAGLLQPASAQGPGSEASTEGSAPSSTSSATTSTAGPTTTTSAPTTTTTAVPSTTTAPPPPVEAPDAHIRRAGGAHWAGGNHRSPTAIPQQTRRTEIGWRETVVFDVRIQNDGDPGAAIRVTGTRSNLNYTVRYRFNGVNITPVVVNGGRTFAGLATGETRVIRVEVIATGRAAPGTRRRVEVRARPTASNVTPDLVVAVADRPRISSEQRQVLNQVNTTRRRAGRAPVAMHAQLARKAQAWAERMATRSRLSHSTLSAGVPSGWRALAENVGSGRSLPTVHSAFLRSSGHRSNINGPYNFVGTGQAWRGGSHWVVHVFMRR